MPVWRIRTIILTECPKLTENRVTLPSPSLGDLIEFFTSDPTAFAFTPLREPQTSQRHREQETAKVPGCCP